MKSTILDGIFLLIFVYEMKIGGIPQ